MTEYPDWFSMHGKQYIHLPIQFFNYYADAVKINEFFKCERCGHCCRDIPAQVCPEDIVRIAHHLDKSVEIFMKEFIIEHDDGSTYLYYPCPFFTERGCKIYQVRPLSCALHPFLVTYEDPLSTALSILQISRDCALANKIYSAFIKLCENEFKEVSRKPPKFIEEAIKEKEMELDERFPPEKASTEQVPRLVLSLRIFRLFVKRLAIKT